MLPHEKIVIEVLRGRVDHDHASLIRAIRKWVKEARAEEREDCAKVAQAVKQLADYPREGIEDYLLRRFVQECVDQDEMIINRRGDGISIPR